MRFTFSGEDKIIMMIQKTDTLTTMLQRQLGVILASCPFEVISLNTLL